AFELEADIRSFIKTNALGSIFKVEYEVLTAAVDAFAAATAHLLAQKTAGPLDVATGAVAYLTLCGDVLGGWLLLKGAVAAQAMMADGDARWLADKVRIMRIFFSHVVPHAHAHLAAVRAGFAALDGLSLNSD